jgi:phenylacetic acid degradation operon negative regulatory protein
MADRWSELPSDPLQPRELVMTLLAAYVRDHHDAVWSGGLVTVLGELGFSTGAARVALNRFVSRGLLTRVRRGRRSDYRLTERAENLLAEGDRRIFSLGRDLRAPEVWTLLWHDIPEQQRLERGRLARRLRFLGFGTLQDGLWVSPHHREREVAPLLDELGVAARCGVVTGAVSASAGYVPFVRAGWDLSALSSRYRRYASAFGPYLHGGDGARVDDASAFRVRTYALHLFRPFPFLDPNLPDTHMPDPNARRDAVEIFDRVYSALAVPAQRHFDRAVDQSQIPCGAGPGSEGSCHRDAPDRESNRLPLH